MVSKQIHTEASPLYDQLAILTLSAHWNGDGWLEHVPQNVLDTARALEVTHRGSFTYDVCWDLWLSSAVQKMPALQRMAVQIPRRMLQNHVLLEDKHALHVLQTGWLSDYQKAQIHALMQACINGGRSMHVSLDCRLQSELEEMAMRVELNVHDFASSHVIRKEDLLKHSKENSELRARSMVGGRCNEHGWEGCHPDQEITVEALKVTSNGENMKRKFELDPEDARLIWEANHAYWGYGFEMEDSDDESEEESGSW